MRLLIINPNTTEAMTRSVEAAATAVAAPETRITAVNPEHGPAAIQGPEDGERALPGLYQVFEREIKRNAAHDAVIIACFDDTGLWELRERAPQGVPVIGIGEAGYHAAMLLSTRFSVVTTLAVSVPVLEENIARYGFAQRCARVRASGVPVLDLESAKERSHATIEQQVALAFSEDGVQAVVLGCAGMADLAQDISRRFRRPVIDGVAAAVGLCETLYRSTKPLKPA